MVVSSKKTPWANPTFKMILCFQNKEDFHEYILLPGRNEKSFSFCHIYTSLSLVPAHLFGALRLLD